MEEKGRDDGDDIDDPASGRETDDVRKLKSRHANDVEPSWFSPHLEKIPKKYLEPRNGPRSFKDNPGAVARLLLEAYKGNEDKVQCAARLARRVVELLENDLRSPRTDLFIDAAASGMRSECRRRLERGQDVDAKQSILGYTALHAACDYGYMSIIKLLVAWDADIHVERDSDGNCPLHCAAENGHANVVEYLIESGADKTRVNKDGLKAYDLALDQNQTFLLHLLREPPGIPESLIFSNITSREATLRWKKPPENGAPIDSYEIMVVPVSGVETELHPETLNNPRCYATEDASRTVYRFENDFFPATEYFVSVRAHNSAGWSERSVEMKLTTLPDLPLAPSKPTFASATSISMTLVWNAPVSNNGAMIYNYEVQLYPGPGEQKWVTVTDRVPGAEIEIVKRGTGQYRHDRQLERVQHLVSELTPGSSYMFRVRGQNKVGWGDWGPESDPFRTRPPATAVTIRARSISLEWGSMDPPPNDDEAGVSVRKDVVEKWMLQMSVKRAMRNEKWKTLEEDLLYTNHIVRGLVPATSYVFRVRPFIARKGWLEWEECGVSKPLTTLCCQPDEPEAPIQADETHQSIALGWEAPQCNGGTIDMYAVRMCPERGLSTWTVLSEAVRELSFEAKDLEAGAKYLFQVRAHNEFGWSSYSETSKTCVTRALPPPHAPKLLRKADSYMYLRWNMPPDCALKIESYELQMRRVEDCEPLPWECIAEELRKPEWIAKDLLPVTDYEFRARALHETGWSNWGKGSGVMRTKRRF